MTHSQEKIILLAILQAEKLNNILDDDHIFEAISKLKNDITPQQAQEYLRQLLAAVNYKTDNVLYLTTLVKNFDQSFA